MENKIILEDLENIVSDINIPWELLDNKNILVTGATGLIGSLIVKALLTANDKYDLQIHVIALIRNIDKANRIFNKNQYQELKILVGDIGNVPYIEGNVDYIVHTASQTSSKGFVTHPVETIKTSVNGTLNLLELAVEKKVDGFLYLSTMEVYGTPITDEKIVEKQQLSVDVNNIRNCYPISKILCENLCKSYSVEYGVKTSIARLTQTFGAGVEYTDGRVFAEFARCAVESRDIGLKTKGETKRNYVYTSDAVRALLTILLKAEHNGDIYNVANEDTYCSIVEMANLVAKDCAENKISVKYELVEDINMFGYAPVLHMNLDTSKIKELGWQPRYDLREIYDRLIHFLQS